MGYLDELRQEIERRIGRAPSRPNPSAFGKSFEGQMAWSNAAGAYANRSAAWRKNLQSTLEELTSPLEGGRPTRSQFVSVANANHPWGTPQLGFDKEAWASSAFDWMRSNPNYRDWSDEEIRAFLADSADMTSSQAAANEFWTGQNIAWRKADEEARADRERVLSELEQYKKGISEEWITQTLAHEKAYWDQKINATVQKVQEQYASMGRVASPYLLGELQRRLTYQAADALQVRRAQLEQERQRALQYYIRTMNNVMSNTQRRVLSPAEALQMMQAMASGDSRNAPTARV